MNYMTFGSTLHKPKFLVGNTTEWVFANSNNEELITFGRAF